MKKDYTYLIGKSFQLLTIIEIAGCRPQGEQLFYCSCACGTKNHLASKYQLLSGKLKSCGCLKKDNEDLVGKKYSRLTVIEKLNEYIKSNRVFLCRCSCGNEIKTIKGRLEHGYTKSCGCLLREINTKYSNLIGNRYGKLLVVRKLGKITHRRDIYWECQCDCGSIINITTGNLIHGHNIGCGCVNIDNIKKYRVSVGHDPDISIKPARELLRGKVKKLKLDKKVLLRDKYTCQLCNKIGGHLNVHHIIPVHINELLALDTTNMITLCTSCHFIKAHMSNYTKINIALQEVFIARNQTLNR